MNNKNAPQLDLNNRVMSMLVLFCTIIIVFIMISSTAHAEISEISVSPETPAPGETVTVTGKADPGEEIPASISFKMDQDVSDGTYRSDLKGITIPKDTEHVRIDSFGLRAEGVDDLSIRVTVMGLPIPVPKNMININDGVATFGTGKIKSGTYDIRLSGTSSDEVVSLSFNSRATIIADENGNFEYTYNTKNMPEGDFNIQMGSESLPLKLAKPVPPPSSNPGSSGGSGGGIAGPPTIVDADTIGNDGIGEDTGDLSDDSNTGSADSGPDDYVEGFELTPESAGIVDRVPGGTTGIVVGLISMGVILVGYRMNRYR